MSFRSLLSFIRIYRIEGTLGITGLSRVRVLIAHFILAPRCRLIFTLLRTILKGRSAHSLSRYVSWVQNDVNQFGLYLWRLYNYRPKHTINHKHPQQRTNRNNRKETSTIGEQTGTARKHPQQWHTQTVRSPCLGLHQNNKFEWVSTQGPPTSVSLPL